MTVPPRVRVIGGGRAGRSLAGALGNAGWEVVGVLGRGDDARPAARGTDLLVIATPDDAIEAVAARVEPEADAVVAHLSGSLGLDVLGSHPRVAAIHPLVSLPEPRRGAVRLASGACSLWPVIRWASAWSRTCTAAGSRWPTPTVPPTTLRRSWRRTTWWPCWARWSASPTPIGVPLEAYLDLARATLDNVGSLGASAAITGPAARGDWGTMARHLDALDARERPAYLAVAAAARRLVADDGLPGDLDDDGDVAGGSSPVSGPSSDPGHAGGSGSG